ncbi:MULTISPECIES: cupin domain-containing protein [Marinovum]|jgi:uncharacterized cupin superfamily protein|uniref:cupin domain-containing protein n=1 Tax=Marinovum TaxID=367771 RepID=UPI00237B2302|nr:MULTISPECIES: cupin domain-containing protein [Marinovum]MDD9745064.1 cupin domain-containing protein [Marinovum sp. PR37]
MSHVINLSTAAADTSERRLADEPGRVTDGDPHQRIGLHYDGAGGRLKAGSWVSTPGRWQAFTGRDEYCYILRGRCALIHEDGHRQEFGPGDSFLIPNGFRGHWEVLETCEKHFVIFQE